MNLARASELGRKADAHNLDFLQLKTPGRKPPRPASAPQLSLEGGADDVLCTEPDAQWRQEGSFVCGLDMANWMGQLPAIGDIPLQFIRLPVRRGGLILFSFLINHYSISNL